MLHDRQNQFLDHFSLSSRRPYEVFLRISNKKLTKTYYKNQWYDGLRSKILFRIQNLNLSSYFRGENAKHCWIKTKKKPQMIIVSKNYVSFESQIHINYSIINNKFLTQNCWTTAIIYIKFINNINEILTSRW
jgi:hypothetical protein